VLASAAFLVGLLSGLTAFDFVSGLKVLPLSIPADAGILDAQTFCPSVIGFILLCGILFAAPVFLGAGWKFRGRAKGRQRSVILTE
jgi:hypothetical protein